MKALKLYDMLSPYLPDVSDDEQIIDFIGKIMDNIVNAGSDVYMYAISAMTKYTIEELIELDSFERIRLFHSGLIVNNIILLKQFCKEINYASND